ncbi:MAG: DUF2953 domain-containing protein [Clostridiaceae bacterium]|jgi:hypothetical protein|nr:DUF2953 domain-containing protein [Clostridiaceae bacterium]
MNLFAFFYPFFLVGLFIAIMLLTSARISVVLNFSDNIFAYRITGSILKYITVFAIKSGGEKERQKRDKVRKGTGSKEGKYLNLLKSALLERKLKLIHVEKLELEGTYSIGDAAVNAIFFGIFMALWQLLLIILNERFRLEHQSFRLRPDFHNAGNNFKFHLVLRAAIYKILWLLLFDIIKTRKSEEKN